LAQGAPVAAGTASEAPDLRLVPPPPRAGGLDQPEPSAPPPRWRRPAGIGTAVLAALLAGVAIQQELTAQRDWKRADALVLPDGTLSPLSAGAYQRAKADGDSAYRVAWISGCAAAASAVASGVLLWLSRDPAPSR
jgi:hypothetical protein